MTGPLHIDPVRGLPEVTEGVDLAALLEPSLRGAEPPVAVVVSSKVLSKALGLRAPAGRKDHVIEAETLRVVAERRAGDRVTRVVESAAGPVMAAAGVDASNVGGEDVVLVLPRDADVLARRLRSALLDRLGWSPRASLAVVVSDTAGRPWRGGLTDFALGSAGIVPQQDHRGEGDADGRSLSVTVRCVVDELAAAADLVKGKATGTPAAVVSGLPADLFDPDARGARSVVRTGPGDWFALGHVEAVRAALGVLPGSADAARVGLPPAGGTDPLAVRCHRAVGLALDDDEVAVDIAPGADGVVLAPTGADRAVGRFAARLEVAAWAEGLVLDASGGTLRLSDAGAAGSAGGSAGSSADRAAAADRPQH